MYKTAGITIFILYFFFFLNMNSGCSINREMNRKPDQLRKRVEQYYGFLSRKNFNACYSYWNPKTIGGKEDFLRRAKRLNLEFKSYEILDISVVHNDGTVYMNLTVVEKEQQFLKRYVDYWKFSGGTWRLIDFGRTQGEGTVKEFHYPEDFKPIEPKVD